MTYKHFKRVLNAATELLIWKEEKGGNKWQPMDVSGIRRTCKSKNSGSAGMIRPPLLLRSPLPPCWFL